MTEFSPLKSFVWGLIISLMIGVKSTVIEIKKSNKQLVEEIQVVQNNLESSLDKIEFLEAQVQELSEQLPK